MRAVYAGQSVTVTYQMHDPATVVLNDSLMVFSSLSEVSAESLSPVTPTHWFGGSIPVEAGGSPVIAVRFLLSYDQKGPGVKPFSEQGTYIDGFTSNGAVLQDMMNRLTAQ